ncbi:MAG: hybrid sensor histidine kinase/response regulator [Sphingobacteriaceae bacterium]|nr:MAG: hybrid sensor histidine kinase/response regulator [Sphingobacteriaceae bacterium]
MEHKRLNSFKGIKSGEVRYIKGDKQDNVWIVSDLTLYHYNTKNRKITSYNFNETVINIHIADNGTFWAVTGSGILKRFDKQNNRFIDYKLADYNQGKPLSAVQDIHTIGDTAVLAGTMNQVLLFNYTKLTLTNVFKADKSVNDVHTHIIFKQSNDEYWLGTEAGLYIYNIKTGNINIVQKQYSNPYSITDNVISSIYKDTEGGTWVGTYFGGINYYSKQYNNFQKYFQQPGTNSLNGNVVHEICQDKYGKIWIGTEDAGLNQLDPATGKFKHFNADGKTGSISYRNIHGIVADDDKLWIGTYEHGLDVLDLKTNKVIKHYNAGGPTSFNSNFIVTMYKTRAGDILVGTWSGMSKYNRKNDNFMPMPDFNFQVQGMFEDEQGTLWASTYGGGVYYKNFRTGKKGHLMYTPGNAKGLINNYVNSLFRDSRHNMWFCTESGLSMYNPLNQQFTNYTVADGLPNNQVYRVQEDQAGLLWVSTSNGLSKFNPANGVFTNYHTANGLPTEQFNYNSSYKTADGTLYFGTVKGMISFKPSAFVKNSFVPPVFITGLQVNNSDVVVGEPKSVLQSSITNTKSITLPYDSSNVSFDVAALSYIIPEMNGYAYKMDGVDKNWTKLKVNRKIYYTKLAPGSYTFRVKGSNSEEVWNNKETLLQIRVLPPYWATWWAYTIYALIAAAIIYVIFRYYHIAIEEKNKRLIGAIEINTEREIYNAKIEFFTNVAHEIRTPLTLIKMPLDKLLGSDINDANMLNDNLNIMKKNTNRLIDLTNQLLDFRKAEANKFSLNFSKTDINEILNETYLTFKPAADLKGISFKLELPRITLHAFVDVEALRKILSNLFNNAIKYAGNTVFIKLLPFSSEDTCFNVEVRNDGYVVADQYREKIFEPFFRIKETEKETGTGIGLPLSRSLAQLHKGNLTITTTDGRLNIFLLSLPIHQETELNIKGDAEEENVITYTEPANEQFVPDNSKPLILLVEDNKDILNYIQHELSVTYNVLKASNGYEALTALQNEHIKLVVSDIMMPIMDGIELCKKIKTDIQYSHIPVILLTAKNSLNSKIEGLEVGADAYIEKPFAFEHLVAQMSNLLSNRLLVKDHFLRSPITHIKGIASSKTDKDFLEQLNNVIYDNITDMDLGVEQLSSMMNMSRPTLYRKIKGLSDLTPNELINITRLKKAAELLASGDYKINEVANMIGYSMPSNFSRDFQRQFGVSPSNYMHEVKNSN